MEDAADTAICMVVVSVCLECQRKKCQGAVPDVSVSPRTTAEMLMLFDTCFCRAGFKNSVMEGTAVRARDCAANFLALLNLLKGKA